MKKPLHQKIIGGLRSSTPLAVRHKIGPLVAYILYTFKIYLLPNRKRPHVLSIIHTIDLVKKEKLSVIRFGDGEIDMLDGSDTAFQKRQGDLATRLEAIIRTNNPKLLICIPSIWERLDKYNTVAYWFIMHQLYRNGHIWKSLLSYDQIYGDAFMSRPYLTHKDKTGCDVIFKKLFSIWEDTEVVLIEGEKSRNGVGNDMFDGTISLQRILCPPENAYSKYEIIKKEALTIPKNKLVLISLGPTAKVLAYDLFLSGYRVLDIGHIDMEYEMYLIKETKQVKVKYKYFNEIHERNPDECNDPKYLSQIIKKIQ